MELVSRIKKRYRKSNNFLLALKLILDAFAMYFVLRLLIVSIGGLVSSGNSTVDPSIFIFGMFFTAGLSNSVELIEMLFNKEKEDFTITLIITIFLLGVSSYWLLV
ncbi:hypothetical protein [Sutcliffiella deserti]|uniref:hypothetical protein n=1 Tax=Sutcliffiella deserti TaxID=2875501 RepID=UPI001CC0651D|nr:hypothetical protein [Sutcliffiella deserti]